MMQEEKLLAYRFKGVRYDCGSKLGYLQATVAYGKKHPETGAAFTVYLKSLHGWGGAWTGRHAPGKSSSRRN